MTRDGCHSSARPCRRCCSCSTIALCVFQDDEQVVFPRWVGYFNIFVATAFLPGALIYYFKSGPFGWNGIFAFWLALFVFCLWYVVMFVVLRASIHRQSQAVSELG